MINRRDFIGLSADVGATLGLSPRLLAALNNASLPHGQFLQRAIPSTGEIIPVIGLGSSATFATVARAEDAGALKSVFETMADRGARVFDTAPSYGASEQVAGDIVHELGMARKMFWATKMNVAGRGGTHVDREVARDLQAAQIDLMKVHNMGDPATQLPNVREFKKAGRVRYVGSTTMFPRQCAQLIDVMRHEPLDCIGVDYAAGKELPAFAKEFAATTWAQFFLEFTLTHPAITAVTPATSQVKNMLDNIGGGIGRLPTAAHRQQITEFVDALPALPGR